MDSTDKKTIWEGRVRVDQTRHDLDALQQEIARWIVRRHDADTVRQYHTQLQTLSTFFGKALSDLRDSLLAIPPAWNRGMHYAECRKFDRCLVIVRRVWEYFRARFDQRDDPRLAPVLKSADEIVWSCYRGSMQSAAEWVPQPLPTTPLPFIQARYSPEAHTRDVPPADLKSDPDLAFAREFLAKLPVPVVGLPPMCVESPWLLAILGHEVGHHFQYDALPKFALSVAFANLLRTSIQGTGATDAQAQRWGKWQEEIFADVYSLLQVGPAAAWAIMELEWADDAVLVDGGKSNYPIPVVRLALLRHCLAELKFVESSPLWSFDEEAVLNSAERRPELSAKCEIVRRDLASVPHIAKTIVKDPLPGLATQISLTEFAGAHSPRWNEGTMESWQEQLLGRAPILPTESLEAPRLVISAAVAVWQSISMIFDDDQRERDRSVLRSNLLDILPQCREPGTRAARASPDTEAIADLGAMFAGELQNTPNVP